MNKKASLLALVMLCCTLGCHSQVTPTNSVVTLGGTVPAPSGTWLGCVAGQPACTFVFSRALVTGATCPPATGSTYTPLNLSSPATTLAYTDNTVSGLTACYIGQILQAGNVSQPSNTAGPFVVPASPLAPSVVGQTSTAGLVKPALLPDTRPVLAVLHLTARIAR